MSDTLDVKGPHQLLRKRYDDQKGAWVYLTEVRNATGYKANSAVDALALSLWPSRGIELHGHEIKVSRSDWLKELKDVHKSQPVQRYCDRWWLVVADPEIVQPGELPPMWGFMAVKGGRLVAVKEAPKLDREPWDPTFVAAVFRGFMKDIDRGWVRKDIHAKLERELADLEPEIQRRVDEVLERRQRQNENSEDKQLRADLKTFEEVTGREIRRFGGRRMGDLVNIAEVLQGVGHPHVLNHLCNGVEITLSKLRAAQAALGDYSDPEQLAVAIAKAAARVCTCQEGTVGQRCATTEKWVSFDCPVHGR
jgi:hypothetical protein